MTCSLQFWKLGPYLVHSIYILNDNCKEKQFFYLSNFENKDAKLCFYCYLKQHLGTLDNTNRLCLLSSTSLNSVKKTVFWSCWAKLKPWTIYCALWSYLKRCFGSLNCWGNFKSKDAKWCILTLFEFSFRKLELLRTFWKQGS